MTALLDIPEDRADEPWFIEEKDRNPASELQRQTSFLALLARLAPAVDALAIPNAGKSTDWERVQRWKEGARRGALDLVITWQPTRAGDRGVFFAEWKNGTETAHTGPARSAQPLLPPTAFNCGVYRKPETLIEHLRVAGAPFIGRLT
jgi:hypothetical protein